MRVNKQEAGVAALASRVQMNDREKHRQLNHLRFGHIGEVSILKGIRSGIIDGCDAAAFYPDEYRSKCTACLMGRAVKGPSTHSRPRDVRARYVGEVVHVDIMKGYGESHDRHNYALVTVDEYSRWIKVYLLRNKGEATAKLAEHIEYLERQRMLPEQGQQRVKVLKKVRTDGGTELVANQIKALCSSKGIEMVQSAPYTPKQNGTAERAIRTLRDILRPIVLQSRMTLDMWDYALIYAARLTNCLVPKIKIVEDGEERDTWWSAQQLWNDYRTTYSASDFPVFGCDAIVLPNVGGKADGIVYTSALQGFFVGTDGEKYRIHVPELVKTLEVAVTNVKLDEHSFMQSTANKKEFREDEKKQIGFDESKNSQDADLLLEMTALVGEDAALSMALIESTNRSQDQQREDRIRSRDRARAARRGRQAEEEKSFSLTAQAETDSDYDARLDEKDSDDDEESEHRRPTTRALNVTLLAEKEGCVLCERGQRHITVYRVKRRRVLNTPEQKEECIRQAMENVPVELVIRRPIVKGQIVMPTQQCTGTNKKGTDCRL